MSYKTIVSVVTNMETDHWALNAAVTLAQREEAHLDVLCLGIDRTQPGFYYAGASAVVLQDNLIQAQAEAEELEKAVDKHLAQQGIPYGVRGATTQFAGLSPIVAHRTRLADLVVLPKPYGDDRPHEHEAILEATLFSGSVPVLVIPDKVELPASLSHIVVAWNESRESLTAIRSALPFLQQSAEVSIAIIEPPAHGPDRSDPGGELSQVLSRHGVRSEVCVLAKTMPRISDIICRLCDDKSADMVVMGAYGHSRFREAILGGATRNMLEMAEIPVLMAH
ncbi:universal stress protein [Psychromarinibacter sp. C21-152]|uniref:Universal stress protein n=1 Tax=Psychromarinibacter sediminicola TaxID=3033385 RepID=A0AAE3T8T7_9RHOB|nr:universal stress protein [Psychromarinibacter sediminicola]MDF0601073.1 universal stress protein [Psychromarinibacter sediminicola]